MKQLICVHEQQHYTDAIYYRPPIQSNNIHYRKFIKTHDDVSFCLLSLQDINMTVDVEKYKTNVYRQELGYKSFFSCGNKVLCLGYFKHFETACLANKLVHDNAYLRTDFAAQTYIESLYFMNHNSSFSTSSSS